MTNGIHLIVAMESVVAKQQGNMIARFTTALLSNRNSDHDFINLFFINKKLMV